MKMLRFEVCEDDELLLRGNSTPLESIRSCELAVECWNLRNSIAEADESFHNTKKDLKMQKYTLRRVQSDLQLLLKSMRAKDSQLQAKDDEITKLKTLEQKWNSSRSFFINSISKLEHSHEETLSSHSRLDSENKTLKLQLQEQDKEWKKKFTAMEAILTSNARQVERERDVLRIQLECNDGVPYKKTTEVAVEVDNDLNPSYQHLFEENNQLKESLLHLKDQCAWQTELEQAYEALHTMYEVSEAEKIAALQRVSQLQRQRTRLRDYVMNKGVQLPTSLCADDS